MDEKELYVILGILGITEFYGLSTDVAGSIKDDDIRLTLFSLSRKGMVTVVTRDGQDAMELTEKSEALREIRNSKKTFNLQNLYKNTTTCVYVGKTVICVRAKGLTSIKYYISFYTSLKDWIEDTEELVDQIVSDEILYDDTDLYPEYKYEIDILKKKSMVRIYVVNDGGSGNEAIYITPAALTELIISDAGGKESCFNYSKKKLLELLEI